MRNAVDYYLETNNEMESQVEDKLTEHLDEMRSAPPTEIVIKPGMTDLYQRIFREYAQGIQENLSEEAAAESGKQIEAVFEPLFKSTVSKIRDAEAGPV